MDHPLKKLALCVNYDYARGRQKRGADRGFGVGVTEGSQSLSQRPRASLRVPHG